MAIFVLPIGAQVRVRPAPPVLIDVVPRQGDASIDPGPPVRMLESPNIDRFLRKAQEFLSRGDHRAAIKILQDVVEGRTLEDPAETISGTSIETLADPLEDPANAVFSNDGRLYRPVRRLCHELLAAMPSAGISIYRSMYEVAAERAFDEARVHGGVHSLERIYNTWFATVTAARALSMAGDLLMDRGTFRAAVQTYRTLLDTQPFSARQAAGIIDTYVRFKIALCFQRLGDQRKAAEVLQELVSAHPGETMRIMGELVPVSRLADEGRLESERRRFPSLHQHTPVLPITDPALIPLWEHRFAEPEPYRGSQPSRTRSSNIVAFNGTTQEMMSAPRPSDFVPGTSVCFMPSEILFLDHYRLRSMELLSGRMLLETDGTLRPPTPQQGTPRSRVPAYDFGCHRVAFDDRYLFTVLGPRQRRLDGMRPVLENTLVAQSRAEFRTVWSSDDSPEFKDTTFLATPTQFADRLLVPVSHNGMLGLQCVDAASGALVFHSYIHRDGTEMARPPASPVTVDGGIAYVLTNAGAVASIDAYTGELRWIRRYERTHPIRPTRVSRSRRQTHFFGGQFFQEIPLYGFAPSHVVAHDGLVVVAPCDSKVMLCLDGATGEPVWMLSQMDMQYIVGHNADLLLAAGPDSVYGIGLRTGVRLWRDELPARGAASQWRGRGIVAGDHIVIPGARELFVRSLATGSAWKRHAMPSLSFGREPLGGPCNLQVNGAVIAVSYESGVELYSTASALAQLAEECDDPLRKAAYLAQAGELLAAIRVLEAADPATVDANHTMVTRKLLSLSAEVSLAMATHGARDNALELLERCRVRLDRTDDLQRWHLARLDVFRALVDLEAVEREQDDLHRILAIPRRQKP